MKQRHQLATSFLQIKAHVSVQKAGEEATGVLAMMDGLVAELDKETQETFSSLNISVAVLEAFYQGWRKGSELCSICALHPILLSNHARKLRRTQRPRSLCKHETASPSLV